MSLTTPALLFPAISLLLLAYTNRFLVLAQLIRQLHAKYRTDPESIIEGQIGNLRSRIVLIKTMQALGVLSFLLCTISMFSLHFAYPNAGVFLFGLSLVSLMASLGYSLYEILISTRAIELELADMEPGLPKGPFP